MNRIYGTIYTPSGFYLGTLHAIAHTTMACPWVYAKRGLKRAAHVTDAQPANQPQPDSNPMRPCTRGTYRYMGYVALERRTSCGGTFSVYQS